MPLQQNQQDQLYKYLLKPGDLPINQPDLQSQIEKSSGITTDNVARGSISSPTPPIESTETAAPMDTDTVETPSDTDMRMKDSFPGHSPQDLEGASLAEETAGKMNDVDKFGADKQKAVLDSILKSRGSFGNRATRGLGALGDALMMNAGKSSPGFLNAINEREGRNDNLAIEGNRNLNDVNLKNMGAKQSLEMQTNTTPLGKAAADFLRPVIKSVYPNLSPMETEKMLQNPFMAAANMGIPAAILESKAKIAMAGAELGIKQQMANATVENQKEMREDQTKKQKMDAAESVVKNSSWIPKILGGTSHKDLQKARDVISSAASGESPPNISSQEEYNKLPSGATYMSNGVPHRKK